MRPRDIGPNAEQWEHDVTTLSADATAWTGNDVRFLTFAEEEITAETIDAEPALAAIARDGVTLFGEPGYLHSKGVG